jgi:ribosomal protein L7/L12
MVLLLPAAAAALSAHAGTPAEAFASAEALFREKKYEDALAAYRAFSERFPKDWRASQAQYTAAFILQKKMSQPGRAREAYERVIKAEPASTLARTAQYHIAEAYEQDGQMQQALDGYLKYLKRGERHARAAGANTKVEFLKRKEGGLPADPPGWGYTLDRKGLRKTQPGEPGEKHGREKRPPEKMKRAHDDDTVEVFLAGTPEHGKRIGLIKVLREITGLGLKDARDMVETAPRILKNRVTREDAEGFQARLEAEGATVELR